MPTTALSTTKRKFHKILDSISNASSTSLVANIDKHNASTITLPTSMDPPTKKPRVDRPSSAYVPSSTCMTTTPVAKSRPLSVINNSAAATMDVERKPPNFAPWDRGQFLERLQTYRHVDKWMGKPEKINEVQWAKRGWSCVGKERVGCVGGCGKEVVIMFESGHEDKENADEQTAEQEEIEEDEDDWREKAQAQLVEEYAEMVISAHDGGCLWRRRGCDGIQMNTGQLMISLLKDYTDTIHRLPVAHQGTAIDNLRARYVSLVAMASDLPPDPTIPEDLDVLSLHKQILPFLHPPPAKPQTESSPDTPSRASDTPPDPEAEETLNHSALSLALFGWQAEEGHILGLATCTACFRRLGLWLFQPTTDHSTPSSMNRLDVVGEHRDYCPWINAISQNGAASRRTSIDGLAGWQILLRAVKASKLHMKYDAETVPTVAPRDSDDPASEVANVVAPDTPKGDSKDRDEKDKERWAKLKRLKQVFHVKRVKGRDGAIK